MGRLASTACRIVALGLGAAVIVVPAWADDAVPTATPTVVPAATPTATPDPVPTPTATPTATPTPAPTPVPTATPTATPTPTTTPTPSANPCGTGETECTLSSAACTILGTAGNDVLTGKPVADVICGLGGDDTIDGEGGDDTLIGGDGHDTLTGGPGNDCFVPGPGDDTITDQQPGEPVAQPGGPTGVSPSGACQQLLPAPPPPLPGRSSGGGHSQPGGETTTTVTTTSTPQVAGPVSVGAAIVAIARLAAAQAPPSGGGFPVSVLPKAHVDRGAIKEVVLCTRPVSGRLVFRTAGPPPHRLLGRRPFSCSTSAVVATHLRTRAARQHLRRSGRLKATVLVVAGAQRRRFPVLLVTP